MGWIWHLCLMNMKRRKIRTFLTVLGVMIGVISVVALLAVGIGMIALIVAVIGISNTMTTSVFDRVNEIDRYIEGPRLRDPRSGSRLFPSKMGLKTKTNRRRDKVVCLVQLLHLQSVEL